MVLGHAAAKRLADGRVARMGKAGQFSGIGYCLDHGAAALAHQIGKH